MSVTTSRYELFLRGTAYLLLAFAGLWVLIDTPRSIAGFWGALLTYLWGGFLLSAVGASIAGFIGRYRIEMIFLPFTFSGMLMYALMIWPMVAEVTTRGPQAFTLTAFAIFLVGRFIGLMKLSRRDPEEQTGPIPLIEHDGSEADVITTTERDDSQRGL